MDAKIKAQWVADLRQDGRKQAFGHLRNFYGGQCCLDVLCEQAVKAGAISEPYLDTNTETYVYSWKDEIRAGQFESETLPDPVFEWAGLDSNNPIVEFDNRYYEPDLEVSPNQRATDSLAELNDTWQFTFSEIADIIEKSDL